MAQLNSLGVLGNASVAGDLKIDGVTTHNNGHIYLTGSNASSSTGNTTQLVFGTQDTQHIVLSSNSNALVINPETNSTNGQIVLYLNTVSSFPQGVSKAVGDSQGQTINQTYLKNVEIIENNGTSYLKLTKGNGTTSTAAITITASAASTVTKMVDGSGNDLNVGNNSTPVYFTSGVPVAVSAIAENLLTIASTTNKGIMQVGTGLSVTNGTVSVSYGTGANTACKGDDARLSNARTPTSHSHGNISNGGLISSTGVALAQNDRLLFSDSSNSGKVERSSITISNSISSQTQSTKFLREDGTWAAPSYTSNTNTTYTFASGTNGFTVTPSGGTATTVTVTPSIDNNITGSGTNGNIAKFNGTNSITKVSYTSLYTGSDNAVLELGKQGSNYLKGQIYLYDGVSSYIGLYGEKNDNYGGSYIQTGNLKVAKIYSAGGIMSGNLLGSNGSSNLGSTDTGFGQLYLRRSCSASKTLDSANPLIEFSDGDRSQYCQLVYTDYNSQGGSDSLNLVSNQPDCRFTAPKVFGAVYNDYAEYRETEGEIEPGRVITEVGNGKLILATERLMRGCEVVSDTFGFAIGKSKKCKTPTAVSGRVLAFPYESLEEFKIHIGWPVCSGPNGTVSIMTEEEERLYPSHIIGTISEVPDYDIWYCGQENNPDQREVKGRVWIRVR